MNRWDWRQLTPGVNTFEDVGKASLTALYQHMDEDGILPVFFYDSEVPGLLAFAERFLMEAEEGRCWLYCAFDHSTSSPLGFAFVNNFMGKSAMCHFGILKAGLPQKKEIAGAWLDFMFMQGRSDNLSCLIGMTPAVYRHAWKFACELGFERKAVIPDACFLHRYGRYTDGILTVYTPKQ